MVLTDTAYGDLKPKLEPRSLTGTLLLHSAEWR
jgi:hypothetical protein